MNVFILCTGRCGSMTFVKACQHIRNYSAAHESRMACVGPERMDYPENHIEADNRLTWLLGRLDREYGDDAFYVHLKRDPLAVAESFKNRYRSGIIHAYWEAIHTAPADADPEVVCHDYVETVRANIELFLRDKTRTMEFYLEEAEEQFPRFWDAIGAIGDLSEAVAEFGIQYNARQ